MKKAIVATVALVLGMTMAARADLLVSYQFTSSTLSPTAVHGDLNGSLIGLSAGSITYGWAASTAWIAQGAAEPYGQSSGGWNAAQGATAFESSKYWEFTVTADFGFTFSITNFSTLHRATAVALGDFQVSINGTQVGSIFNSSSGSVLSYNLGITGFDDLTSATIRVHGWGGTATSTGGGEFRLDNTLLQGTVIPEPGTMVLLGLGMGALAFIRRRMK